MRAVVLVVVAACCALLLMDAAQAVDRSKFRTCSQTAFCKRNRDKATAVDKAMTSQDTSDPRVSASRYQLVASSIQIAQSGGEVRADLQDTVWKLRQPLKLHVQVLQNHVIRVRVTEHNPIHKRWEVRDVLLDEALKPGKATLQRKDSHVSIVYGAHNEFELVLAVAPTPFYVALKVNGKTAIQMNSLGYLNFEQYRQRNPRPAPAPAAPPAEGEAPAATPEPQAVHPTADVATSAFPYDEEYENAWHEQFGSHSDSKPRGPADVSLDVSFVGTNEMEVYGIPEHASPLALKSTSGQGNDYSDPYRLYNLDVFEYELDNPMALYGAIPLMISHDQHRTVGALWLNSAETFIDVKDGRDADGSKRKDTHWMSESGNIDVFLFPGSNPMSIFHQYGSLTGFTALPPLFAVAYHQCRWNYKNEDDVKGVDAGFDENDIPFDVIWLDIEHTDGKKYFTWDKSNFPNPKQMQEHLAVKGRKLVNIVDPHIKRDSGYRVHKEAQDKGLYVKNAKGSDFEGWCWPGSVSYLDFLRPEVRQYWAEQFSLNNYEGSTPNLFVWNDMNEPSVFNGPEVSMHKDCLHGGSEQIEHRDVHNMYGLYNHMATEMGLVQRGQGDSDGPNRPFVLTRSFFPGSQRYAAMWTGDNKANWEHLAMAQPMLLAMNIAGYSFSGADVGGFFGDPSAELLTRWFQAGAFQPFFRGHAHIDTKRREPWVFGEPYTSHIRDAIRTRYAYLPYVYTAFHNASVQGAPVMRPLWVEYPKDAATYKIDDEFLLGADILVRPVTTAGADTAQVYLPRDVPANENRVAVPWYDVANGRPFIGGQTITMRSPLGKIPVLQRGGSIVPRKERARRSSSLMVRDPYTLVVALDHLGSASGSLYVDDGHSYKNKNGDYIHRTFTFSGRKLSSKPTHSAFMTVPSNGRFKTSCTVERVVILGYSAPVSKAFLVLPDGSRREASVYQTMAASPSGSVLVTSDTAGDVPVSRLEIRKPDAPIDSDWSIELA